MPKPNAAFGSRLFTRQPFLAISSERVRGAPHAGCAVPQPSLPGRWSWTRRWVGFWLECAAIACFACLVLLAAGLLACFALCCASAWFFLVTTRHPFLVRVCAGRGQPLCPWDRGDKVVSSCWWVRACFIHPETLFQTLSQVISRRIRPRLAPRTPCLTTLQAL